MAGDRKQPVLRKAVARPDDGPKDSPPSGDALFAADVADRSALVGVSAHPATGNDERVGLTAADTSAPSAVVRAQTSDARAGSNAPDPGICVSFFVRGQPETQGSLRAMRGRIIAANDKELARWRGFVWTTARGAWLGNPMLHDVAIGVDLTFYVVSDRIRRPWMLEPETGLYRLATKGTKDVDKLIRAVFDGITESRVWADDGLVAEVHARAYFASPPDTPPGVQVELRVL